MVTKEQKEKIKNLTWKYFFKQKFLEISLTILIGLAFVFIPYGIGYLLGDKISLIDCKDVGSIDDLSLECSYLQIWGEGFLYFCFTLLVLLICYSVFYKLVLSNWEKAKKRARMDVIKK